MFGGPGPLEAVSIHRVTGVPGAGEHWHVVTYGLSELHGKDSPDRHVSGWGFELTLRTGGQDIPYWAVDLLASLASYLWTGEHPFADGHLIDLRGPIRLDSRSPITAAMMVEDPTLGTLRGPYGTVQFLQVVGLTADELELCRAWDASGVRDLLGRHDRFLLTDLERPSVAGDPRYRSEIEERIRQDGSALHELRVATLQVRKGWQSGAEVRLGAGASAALGPALRRELRAGGSAFDVIGDDATLRFVVGPDPRWEWAGQGVSLRVPLEEVEALASLFDGRTGSGRVAGYPGLRFRVVP